MEEDLSKRNTDCVYFLASPLTCRKGAECEYRHSEVARLNPRDCWYWLSGSCLNPSCGFRHPPLDKPTESETEKNSLHSQQPQSSVPSNKSNVPCYFYFNGYCNKAEKCSFSHGPEMYSLKSTKGKSSSAVSGVIHGENKSASVTETAPPVKLPLKALKPPSKSSENNPQQVHEDLVNSCAGYVPADPIQTKNCAFPFEDSERQVEEHAEREERMESSPGFDVLVDDECLVYEDDEEYRQCIAREGMELNNHFIGEEEYDPSYPRPDHYLEGEMIDSHDRNPEEFDSGFSSKKRRFRNSDLRDHLRRRRVGDHQGDETFQRDPRQRTRHGSASEYGPANGSASNGRSWGSGARFNKSKDHVNDRRASRRQFPSVLVKKPDARCEEEYKKPDDFDGPKPFSEILKDKRKPASL